MNNAKEILLKWLNEGNFKTYKDLANFLGVAPNTLDVWKQRGNIPEKHILKYNEFIRLKNTGNYIKTIQTNNGHIVQGKSIIHDQPTQDPREKTLIDKFRTLSEIGKIEVENCLNNTYLKELKENNK